MTGAGMQNFSRKPMRAFKKRPSISTQTAANSVWYISSEMIMRRPPVQGTRPSPALQG